MTKPVIHVKLDGEDCYRERWATRPESGLIKRLMDICRFTRANMAKKLGINVKNFDMKMLRSSWSIEDLVQIADYCGYSVVLVDSDMYRAVDAGENDSAEETYWSGFSVGYERARADFIEAIQECRKD